MKYIITAVLLALSTSACGNNSVATKTDVEEAVRTGNQSTLPTVSEAEFNTDLDTAVAAHTKLRLRSENKSEIPVRMETCEYASEVNQYRNSNTKKTYSSYYECQSDIKDLDKAAISSFVKKYANGFRVKQKAGRAWRISPDVYQVDAATVTALQNETALPVAQP